MFIEKFKAFWRFFWESMKKAYNKAFRPEDMGADEQEYTEIKRINLLSIFVTKLNNLCNTEATFGVLSDSTQSERLKKLVKNIEAKRSDITEGMLGEGEFYIFPATSRKGELKHSFLHKWQVCILDSADDNITEAVGIINWYIDNDSNTFFLLRHHKLDESGTLTISYSTVTEDFKQTTLREWQHLEGKAYSFAGANHIGFGRYKSPASSRGLSPIYGVPLNFGCGEIEEKIFNDLRLIELEFKNGKSVIFTDPMNLKPKNNKPEIAIRPHGTDGDVMENIIAVEKRSGDNGNNIDIFNPNLRYSEHYSKLIDDMALYEKQVGTSRGILTPNETTAKATATEVKRANADTISLLDKIRTAIDNGNLMTLQADSVFLNISPDLWSYKSDWFDPFEDPAEQWKRLLEAFDRQAAERSDVIGWLFPKLTEKEIEEKLKRINEQAASDTENAIQRMIGGA